MDKKKTDLSRRNFLKNAGLTGAVAGAAAVLGNLSATEATAAADVRYVTVYESVMKNSGRMYGRAAECPGPVGPIGFEDRDISDGEIVETVNCDVVVVGAGITGMIASLKAASMGANVLVIEKMNAGRGIFECYGSVNSKVLKNAGYEMSGAQQAELIREIYTAAGWRLRRGAVHTFISRSGEAADFMEDMFSRGSGGIHSTPSEGLKNSSTYECAFTVPALPVPAATGLPAVYVVRELASIGRQEFPDKYSIRFNTPAVQLIREQDGPVKGVIAKNGRGYLRINAAKGVILATGGYDANPEMMAAYCRSEDYANLTWWNGHFGTTGDGHMMGMRAGAIIDSVPHAIMSFNGGGPWKFIRRDVSVSGGFRVNSSGKRFMDEGFSLAKTTFMINASSAQENFGRNLWQIGNAATGTEEAIAEFKAAGAFKGPYNTLEELAEACGINAANLRKTAEDWNSYCDTGVDLEFGRGQDLEFGNGLNGSLNNGVGAKFSSPLTAANKVNMSGPFYAFRPRIGYMLATVSGLQIDENCNVLDADDKPIEGLYAGGNASGCFFNGNYPRHVSGSSVGRAITFGYVSAEHACNRS